MFWPFRLLIAALMTFVVLVLIIGAINYFNGLKVQVSMERLASGFDNAWGAITTPDKPEKGLKKEENLTIPETTISSEFFARRFNLKRECIEFQAITKSPFKVSSSGLSVKVKQESVTNVYFLCVYENDPECEERCYISFGKKPEVP